MGVRSLHRYRSTGRDSMLNFPTCYLPKKSRADQGGTHHVLQQGKDKFFLQNVVLNDKQAYSNIVF